MMARTPRWMAVMAMAAITALIARPAGAVITLLYPNIATSYGLTLQVGASTGASTNTVAFSAPSVPGQVVAPVTGTPTISVLVTPSRPALSSVVGKVTLTVDSSAGLSCQTTACGTTLIPFSTISWTAIGMGSAASGDIQSGRFNGATNQSIASFSTNVITCAIVCTSPQIYTLGTQMQFAYDNATTYPAGTYSGVVHFTATMQ